MEFSDDPHDNAVTLLSMTVPLPGVEDETKKRWVALLTHLGVPKARELVLSQMTLWPEAHAAIQAGHTVQAGQEALDNAN